MRKSILMLIACIILTCLPALAKEGGDQYPNGAENWFAGAAPPPGRYYVNYLGYYTGQLKDGGGQKVILNGKTPSVDAAFDAFRFVNMTHLKLFGADYGVQIIIPVVYQSMDFNGRASTTNIGDITIDPSIFGWNSPRWHALAAVDIYLPTGYYDQNDSRISIGANYYGFDPLFAISYMPKSDWELSVKVMYNLKTSNPVTDYHSGQEFHTDYAAGKHFGSWMVGMTGYAVKQTTDDTIAGHVVPASAGLWSAGRRGQVLAIGPSIGYSTKTGMTFMADWQQESLVRNRFGGDKVWFKMIIPLKALFRRNNPR